MNGFGMVKADDQYLNLSNRLLHCNTFTMFKNIVKPQFSINIYITKAQSHHSVMFQILFFF